MNADVLARAGDGNASAAATVEAELLRAWEVGDKLELDAALTLLARQAGDGRQPAADLLLRFVHRSQALRPIIARYVPDSEVDDVQQKTLMAIQRSVGSFQGRSRFMTWLHSVAVNTALSHHRTIARRNEIPEDDDPPGDESARVSSVVARREDIRTAIRRLPTDQQVVLALWEAGHSYDDIATELGVPVGTVRSRISRARERVRELISDDERGEA